MEKHCQTDGDAPEKKRRRSFEASRRRAEPQEDPAQNPTTDQSGCHPTGRVQSTHSRENVVPGTIYSSLFTLPRYACNLGGVSGRGAWVVGVFLGSNKS